MKKPDFKSSISTFKILSTWIHRITIYLSRLTRSLASYRQPRIFSPAMRRRSQLARTQGKPSWTRLRKWRYRHGRDRHCGTRIPCEVKEDRREHEQPPEAVNPNANGHIQTFHDTRGFHRRQIQGTIPYLLQMERNKYAAKKLEEQNAVRKRPGKKQLAENEKAQYRADITVLLDTTYAAYVEKHINALNEDFQSCLPSHVWGRMPADHANKHRFLMDGFREKRRG